MKIIYPKRCPNCREYNLGMSIHTTSRFKRYALVCETPGCWFYGQRAWTRTGAIIKWNRGVEA